MEYRGFEIIGKVVEFFDIIEAEGDFSVDDELSGQTITLMIGDENYMPIDDVEYESIDDIRDAIDALVGESV